MTANSAVAWFVVSDESKSHRRIIAATVAGVTDATGAARLDVGAARSPRALWVAVDVASGSVVAATSAGGRVDLSTENASAGAARQLARDGSQLMLLLARPGVGAWSRAAEDSGIHDADRRPDDRIILPIDQLVALPGSPASAQSLRTGDFAIAADLTTLTVTRVQFR